MAAMLPVGGPVTTIEIKKSETREQRKQEYIANNLNDFTADTASMLFELFVINGSIVFKDVIDNTIVGMIKGDILVYNGQVPEVLLEKHYPGSTFTPRIKADNDEYDQYWSSLDIGAPWASDDYAAYQIYDMYSGMTDIERRQKLNACLTTPETEYAHTGVISVRTVVDRDNVTYLYDEDDATKQIGTECKEKQIYTYAKSSCLIRGERMKGKFDKVTAHLREGFDLKEKKLT